MVTTPRLEGLSDWRPLARGGFAVVWEARQESLNRLVAVKIITRKLDNPEERDRFLRESGAAGRMSSHPGIVTVHYAGLLDDDRPYLVMELCTGGSLTRRLEEGNRPSQEWVRDLGVRIADALAAAHDQGVLHRDVKPANVLIDQYGHAGLADFGLAVMTDGMELEERLEALTPAYAPPEAFAPHSPTTSGDVYSLAATLYALLCGHAPRAVDPGDADPDMTAAQVVMAHLDDPVERLPDVDPALMDLLLAALDDDPTRRPTAAAFRDGLAALPLGVPTVAPVAQLDEPVTTRPEAGPSSGPASGAIAEVTSGVDGADAPRPRRRPGWPVLAAAAALLALIVLVGMVLTGRGDAGAVPPPVPSAPPATSASPTPSPSTVLLAGFTDCSETVGRPAQCAPKTPQCWGQLLSVADALYVATPRPVHEQPRLPDLRRGTSREAVHPQVAARCGPGGQGHLHEVPGQRDAAPG